MKADFVNSAYIGDGLTFPCNDSIVSGSDKTEQIRYKSLAEVNECAKSIEDEEKELPRIKVVIAGTIGSGKTTLLSALYSYVMCSDVLHVSPKDRETSDFCSWADDCLQNGSKTDIWFGATKPQEFNHPEFIVCNNNDNQYIVSFSDFAGEIFVDAYDGKSRPQSVAIRDAINAFKKEVGDAKLVLISISCQDILHPPQSERAGGSNVEHADAVSRERMRYAYIAMIRDSAELLSRGDVKVRFLITQCDKYKALFARQENFLEGEPIFTAIQSELQRVNRQHKENPIETLYVSSVSQTKVKAFGDLTNDEAILNLMPMSKDEHDTNLPRFLGLDEIWKLTCGMNAVKKQSRATEVLVKSGDEIVDNEATPSVIYVAKDDITYRDWSSCGTNYERLNKFFRKKKKKLWENLLGKVSQCLNKFPNFDVRSDFFVWGIFMFGVFAVSYIIFIVLLRIGWV